VGDYDALVIRFGDQGHGRGHRGGHPTSKVVAAPASAWTTSTSPAATKRGIIVVNAAGQQRSLSASTRSA